MALWDLFKKKENKQEDVLDEITEDEITEAPKSLEETSEKDVDFIEEEEMDESFEDSSMEEKEINIEIEEETESNSKEDRGFFARLLQGLEKTRANISNRINEILATTRKVDEEMLEDLEDILISSDLGMESTVEIIDQLRDQIKLKKINNTEDVKIELTRIMKEELDKNNLDNKIPINDNPLIILVVGVNGVGKTTTIGKMAYQYKEKGKKVLMVAADTFRAAAIEQLTEWAHRADVEIVAQKEGSDPASVIYDGIAAAKAAKSDIIICDTAGRLHNKKNLMNELNKIHRVIEKEFPEAKKEVLLVLDGTTGQNAIHQAKEFKEVAEITGIVITKLDGTAKGGVIFPLQAQMQIPVKLIGVGEDIKSLMEFNSEDFVDAIVN